MQSHKQEQYFHYLQRERNDIPKIPDNPVHLGRNNKNILFVRL